jgi:hypothetical protein
MAGCEYFIRKPYRDTEIFNTLTKHLGIRFVYEEERRSATEATRPLTGADLAELPTELRNELKRSIVVLDIGGVNHAIEAIRAHNPTIAQALVTSAKDLQFGHILRLIKSSHGKQA